MGLSVKIREWWFKEALAARADLLNKQAEIERLQHDLLAEKALNLRRLQTLVRETDEKVKEAEDRLKRIYEDQIEKLHAAHANEIRGMRGGR